MMHRPLGKQVDGILEVLYDASDVPNARREYVNTVLDDYLWSRIDRAVVNYMDNLPDNVSSIRDLQHRIARIENTLDQIAISLRKR